jgi:23S rRNA pseudouridine2605 synthase
VSRLIRIRYGAMLLPRGLRRGAWMELHERDIRALGEASGTPERVIRGAPEPRALPQDKPRRARSDRGRGSGPRPNVAGGRPPEEAPRPFARGPRRRDDAPRGGGARPARSAEDLAGLHRCRQLSAPAAERAARWPPSEGGAGGPRRGPRGGGSRARALIPELIAACA